MSSLSSCGFGFLSISQVDHSVLQSFSCGSESLDDFLINEAQNYHSGRIGFTNCVFHRDFQGLVGFYTMSNESIKLNSSEFFELAVNTKTPLQYIPAVLIGRFAVRKELQKSGNGTNIMELAIGQISASSGPSTARLAIVDAINNDRTVQFYMKCGFQQSLAAAEAIKSKPKNFRPHTVKMFLDVFAER